MSAGHDFTRPAAESARVAVPTLGPADHGRPVSYDGFCRSRWEGGYQYELVDGRLYVTPFAEAGEHFLETWLTRRLTEYTERRPESINYVSNKARVFVPNRSGMTCIEPDVAAYRDLPLHLPIRSLRWEDVSPVIVAEIVSDKDPDKDLIRNVELYFQVPSVEEYWMIDVRRDVDRPVLIRKVRAEARVPKRYADWVAAESVYPFGSTFTSRLLPGFSLVIDPRR